jgi:hypothetical protein
VNCAAPDGACANEPVAIAAHDAGGAEVLSSYVRRTRREFKFALEGPACKIFERKLGPVENVSLEEALAASRSLLCGTSWQSDLELRAVDLARVRGLPSSAWLDHWVNFRCRFERGGLTHLPDAIWVSDLDALRLARQELPEVTLRLVSNPYVEDLETEVAQATPLIDAEPGRLRILYVCEPVAEAALRQFGDAAHWGYTEHQALRYFLDNLGALGTPAQQILIRPHPSEHADKYRDIAAEFSLPIRFSAGHPLCTEVASSDCVVGCGSMAMVIALAAGKRVLSSIPPGGPTCPLPQSNIRMLRDLVSPQR